MKRHLAYCLAAIILLATAGFIVVSSGKYKKEIPLANEKELKVNIEAGLGDIRLSKGTSSTILDVDVDADLPADITEFIDYSNRDRVGYLTINTTEAVAQSHRHRKKTDFHFGGFDDNDWNMRFTDAVPISFDIELGMGKGDLDFTGLNVKDLNLSTGASSVTVRFDKPNKNTIDHMTVGTGLSKFRGEGLCNANFRHFKFQGGVGGYTLDFSGQLEREVEVDIEVGLGSVTVIIPDDVGAKIDYEKNFLSGFDYPRDFSEQEENNYLSSNYYSTSNRMNFHIEAGLGSVKVKRK